MAKSALIIDSDAQHNAMLEELLAGEGWSTLVCGIDELEGLAQRPTLALVSLDEGPAVLAALDHVLLRDCEEVFLMSRDDDPRQIRRGIRAGANYFFAKPLDAAYLVELLRDIENELQADQTDADPSNVPVLDQFGHLRGSSRPMRKLYRVLRKVAPTLASVLVVGESGTGKELVARTLHEFSERAGGPFITMNCSAIPAELFESELFGHEKGSFSGAVQQHAGYFERADGGTLFLDELTEMPLELQVKLLRLLEVSRFRRVGGEEDLDSDVRIVAATNRDPEDAIDEGLLREDLYYRIASFPIHLPPLRDRQSDPVGLAHFFLARLNEERAVPRSLPTRRCRGLPSTTGRVMFASCSVPWSTPIFSVTTP